MSVAENPWIDGEVELTVVEPPQKIEPPTWSVVAGISPEDAGACALPVVLSDHHEDIVLVGAHGGAGTSTLAQLTGLIDGGYRDGEKLLVSHVRGLCRHFMKNFCS